MVPFVNAASLNGIWSQPEKAILFVIKEVDNKPIVDAVYNYTQGIPYCVYDKYDSESMKNYFSNGIIAYETKNKINLKRFKTSFNEPFIKLKQLPVECKKPLETQDPQKNYSVLWQFFNEYYANFDLRIGSRTEWERLGEYYRSQIDNQTSDKKLFDLTSTLLSKLEDGHVELYYQGDFEQGMEVDYEPRKDITAFDQAFRDSYNLEAGTKEYIEQIGKSLVNSFHLIDSNYLTQANHGQEQSLSMPGFPSQPVYTWGVLKLKPEVGYARILQELHFKGSPIESTDEQYQQATQTIDQMMAFYKQQDIKALIIDLRYNVGGDNAINNYLLHYLINKKTTVLKQQSYIDGIAQPLIEFTLSPRKESIRSQDNLFPIYVLSSSYTISSGENLVLSLMALANTKNIGYTTRGIFSDTHTRTLPNGWIFQLPFNKIFAFNNLSYEKVGIPAHTPVDPSNNYLMKTYMDTEQDLILDKLIDEVVF